MKKLPKVNTSKLLKAALPYILVGLMATKLGQAYRMASGGDVLDGRNATPEEQETLSR